jgi:hypothetical protein
MTSTQFSHGFRLGPIVKDSPETLAVLLHDLGAAVATLEALGVVLAYKLVRLNARTPRAEPQVRVDVDVPAGSRLKRRSSCDPH